ncbi:ABC transporter ATP-binding protein [Halococcus saccharolyticus]|nr:ABC transporter ATP-binding protein [Halococcus saccharolyticus]
MTTASDVSITLDGFSRSFGAITALDDVDLTIDGPQIVGVAGPNGSGKTTLIRCLLGLLRPSNGSARVNDTDPADLRSTERARIGYMPQHEAVYNDLTVRENVDFFARLYGVRDREAAVERAIEFVDLGERTDAAVTELSGGMVRRTSLACALVHDPDVLLLDEPTVGVDPELRASMWTSFRERRDAGALMMVSTHYLGEATNCDRVLFLRDGRVLAFDAPESFLDATGTTDLEDAFLALLDRRTATNRDGTGTPGADDAVEVVR